MAPWNDSRPLVLIIDADQTARDLYGDWFSSIGFQVMCAAGTFALGIQRKSYQRCSGAFSGSRHWVTENRGVDSSILSLATIFSPPSTCSSAQSCGAPHMRSVFRRR
jgi:hypothetical protein